MKNNYQLTICILHYRKLPQLKKTIANLEKHTQIPFKIKLLNQQYLDKKIRRYLAEINKKKNIEVIYGKKNLGCPAGRYRLLKNTTTPYIITLDDDIYVHQGWLEPIINFFKKNPQAGAISCPLYNPSGTIDSMGGRKLEINHKNRVIKMRNLSFDLLRKGKDFIEVDDLSGGEMIFRKELLKDFQWDPHYFIGFGDLDKGIQLKKSHYRFYLYLRNKLIHDKVSKHKDKKSRAYNSIRRDYQQIRKSYLYFVKKWGYRLPLPQHIFYKYICLLPNPITSNLVYLWLKFLKPLTQNG